ncbi:MAG: adaptor protein MecA [Ruminococcaceae bacterium]|nr:adaptor protein MecA [Oscillospiraceae bacterium]
MKIERINENKIKIILGKDEITRWSRIANRQIPDYNAMMFDIMTEIERRTGLSFQGSRVVVEASQSSESTYEIYVTRVSAPKPQTHRIKNKNFKPKQRKNLTTVYEFDDIETVCLFNEAHPFYAELFDGVNSLYSHLDKYYLVINVPERFEEYFGTLCGDLSEYGKSAAGTVIPYVLSEHAKCIIFGSALKNLKNI